MQFITAYRIINNCFCDKQKLLGVNKTANFPCPRMTRQAAPIGAAWRVFLGGASRCLLTGRDQVALCVCSAVNLFSTPAVQYKRLLLKQTTPSPTSPFRYSSTRKSPSAMKPCLSTLSFASLPQSLPQNRKNVSLSRQRTSLNQKSSIAMVRNSPFKKSSPSN